MDLRCMTRASAFHERDSRVIIAAHATRERVIINVTHLQL